MRKDLIEGGPFKGLKRNHYGALIADPPWRFQPWSPPPADATGRRDAERHYRTPGLADIKNLPVEMLAAPNAWLFIWVVSSHLSQALEVISAWGFEFASTGFVWIKTKKGHDGSLVLTETDLRVGMGLTTRKGSELCLLARRGNPRRQAKDVREVILAPVREHSRKPDEAYARVQRYCAGPYVDLFARETHDGWAAWGDEVANLISRFARDRSTLRATDQIPAGSFDCCVRQGHVHDSFLGH
jgi:N6-adenosine-specific RNA methylase IME4